MLKSVRALRSAGIFLKTLSALSATTIRRNLRLKIQKCCAVSCILPTSSRIIRSRKLTIIKLTRSFLRNLISRRSNNSTQFRKNSALSLIKRTTNKYEYNWYFVARHLLRSTPHSGGRRFSIMRMWTLCSPVAGAGAVSAFIYDCKGGGVCKMGAVSER